MADRRRQGAAALSAAVLAGLLLAGLPACRRQAPAGARTLRLAVREDVLGFFGDAPLAREAFTLQVNSEIFEGLVRFDRSLAVQPALAQSWETPDEHTYIFRLRPALRFSDGRPLTAPDVVASLLAGRSQAWGTQDALASIESVRALDDQQVEVRTRRPDFLLLQDLHWGFVLPQDELRRTPVRVIGSGPYQLAAQRPGAFALQRNPYYRGPAPAFDRAEFEIVPDAAEREDRLLRGTADVIDNVPPERVAALRDHAQVRVYAGPGLRVLFLGLRVDRPPFHDPRVRQALDLALDRSELLARARLAPGVVARQLVPPTVIGSDPTFVPDPPDPARARALLAAAGHGRRLRVRLDGPRDRYTNGDMILAEVARQLDLAGFEVEVQVLDKRAFFARIDSGASDLHLVGWLCRSGQAGDLLEAMLHSRQDPLGAWNSVGLSDPTLDRMIDEAGASTSEREWSQNLQAAQRRALELRALVPLVVQPEALAFRRGLRWRPSLDYQLWLEDIEPAL